jgi:hypothetical protein
LVKQLLIGLPSTGKTTFLAALWHVVESNEVTGSLHLSRLDGDREYLNRIRTQWLTYKELKRNPTGLTETMSMRLLDDTGTETELVVSDLAGETFRAQWSSRRWDRAFARIAKGADGILLFVHPHEIVEPTTIADVLRLGAAQDMAEEGVDEPPTTVSLWQHEDAATQVELVDLLQFAARELAQNRPVRLALIISAWDIITGQATPDEPAAWVKKRLPLVDQFLRSNRELLPTKIFGVSALGGDLLNDRSQLTATEISANRIVVREEGSTSHDITAPLKWLMRGQDE